MSNWSKYLVTGISVPPGEPVPSRKEIRNLSKEEMYLLLEGLAKFQHDPEDKDLKDPKSWFQIAGIHGVPETTWPSENWNKDIPRKAGKGSFAGFCTHSSILFLTWHRPYLALFEATLHQHVQDIANGINNGTPNKKAYVDAAKNFRLPYWDWARREVSSHFPEAAQNNTYDRRTLPKSSASWFDKHPTEPVYNPLFQWPFPKELDDGYITQGRATTARYPGAGTDALKQLEAAITGFYNNPTSPTGGEKNLSERVAYILLAYQRYGPMSNNQYGPKDRNDPTAKAEIWGSLEDIHNAVHGLTGGRGQMSDPAIAAFDPIFWLHHANIDRLFAIWQALHENSSNLEAWVTTQNAGRGDWAVPRGNPEGKDTHLYPFRPTVDSWYDSKDDDSPTSVKRTEPFGYTYPETAGLKYPASLEERTKLRKKIESYYTNLPKLIRQSKAGDPRAGDFLLPQTALLTEIATKQVTSNHSGLMQLVSQMPEPQLLLQKSLEPEKPFIKSLAPNNEYLEWLVNIKAERHSLGGKFSVHVFLDEVEEDNVILWPVSPHHVGSFVPFGQASETECARCRVQQEERIEITGQIPLTIALVERYLAQILPDLRDETVVPYLTKNLHWRVESGGTVVPNRAEVDGLTVYVVSNKVTLPEDDAQPPIYDPNVTIYPEVTTDRNGEGRGDGTGLTPDQ